MKFGFEVEKKKQNGGFFSSRKVFSTLFYNKLEFVSLIGIIGT